MKFKDSFRSIYSRSKSKVYKVPKVESQKNKKHVSQKGNVFFRRDFIDFTDF
jgi:hypothetical protein